MRRLAQRRPPEGRPHQRRDPHGALGRAQRGPGRCRPGPPGPSCSAPAPASRPDATRSPTRRCCRARTVLQVEEPDGWHDLAGGRQLRRQPADRPALHGRLHRPARSSSAASGCRSSASGSGLVTYRYGGGAAGNVPAGAVKGLAGGSAGVKVGQPAARGRRRGRGDPRRRARRHPGRGAPARPGRHRRGLRRPRRARWPGWPGPSRCRCCTRTHPPSRPPAWSAWWSSRTEDLRDPDAPLPDLGLLRRVARYLDERRLVTTELYVHPADLPRDRGLGRPARSRTATRSTPCGAGWIELLRQYLAPLPPYGPDGAGWPLGRAVRRAELEAVASRSRASSTRPA